MLNPPDQNVDASLSLKVGECPHCQTMFAIPWEADGPTEAQETSLLCPACEAKLSATAVRPRTLPVAKLAPIVPVPVVPTLVTPSEQPETSAGLTASSLLGGVIPQTASLDSATNDALPQPNLPPAKKSLSETLGWTPGDLSPTPPP